jgi:PAS domain S-box-containing protein
VGLQGISRNITARRKAEQAMKKGRDELERRVAERTAELTEVNKRMKKELLQRLLAQEALKKSERRFRELADLLPEIVFETDRAGRVLYCNRVGFEKFGYSKADLGPGLEDFPMIVPRDRERLKRNFELLMRGRELGAGEYLARKKDGSTFPVIIHGSVIIDELKQPAGLRGIMVDITEHKQTEEKLLSHQEKLKALAYELSLAEERTRRQAAARLHDNIGQDISLAAMRLKALQESHSGDPRLSEKLDEVLGALERCLSGTRSLISELSPPVLYEMGFVPALQWLVDRLNREHEVRFTLADDNRRKPLSNENRGFLFYAVRELLMNVIRHAEAREARISVARAGDAIEIIVEDDGNGFDPSELAFNATQAGRFGLFSIRERLEAAGGRLKVESQPGWAARVTIRAPLGK